jgi:hypothetical protein
VGASPREVGSHYPSGGGRAVDNMTNFDHPEIVALLATQWSDPDDGSQWWATYGITEVVRAKVISLQGGCCSICREERPLVVDHCHKTQRVRGLICGRCNSQLGNIADSVDKLRAKATRIESAARYLEHAAVAPKAIGIEAEWLKAKSLDRPRPQPPKPRPQEPQEGVVYIHLPSGEQLLDMWPPGRLHRMPVRQVVCETGWGLVQWAKWVPNEHIEDAVRRPDSENRYEYVRARGEAATADALCFDCETAEQTVGFYAKAFHRMFEWDLRRADRLEYADWLYKESCRLTSGIREPWRHNSKDVLPYVDGFGFPFAAKYSDLEDVLCLQDLVDLLLIHWRHVTEHWTILDFVSDRELGRRQQRGAA